MIQAEYGFIGCGNMGGAIARVLCKTVDPKRVLLSNRTPAKAEALAKRAARRGITSRPLNAPIFSWGSSPI